MSQAYYRGSVAHFLKTNSEEIIGQITLGNTPFASQWSAATISWASFIPILKASFIELIQLNEQIKNWHILLEYELPRILSRIDTVVIADDIIFVIEYKDNSKEYKAEYLEQATGYVSDLSYFHLESRNKTIIPILLCPEGKDESGMIGNNGSKHDCIKANSDNFASIIRDTFVRFHNPTVSRINPIAWERSEYRPTPGIIQAAQELFAGQTVQEILSYGAENLADAKNTLVNIVYSAIKEKKKVICFVTGIPGAGKTLVGLDLVLDKQAFKEKKFNSAYFSGNTPLVNVLKEALIRNDYKREVERYLLKEMTEKPKKANSEIKLKSKIQNLHQIILDGLTDPTKIISENLVVFDEAQRCWNATHFHNKSKQNKNRRPKVPIVDKSEAEILLEFMNRQQDWAVIVALVGGGQEINTGEGGISEWGKAIETKFSNWEVYISPQLLKGDSATVGQTLFEKLPENVIINKDDSLHLNVSFRSPRATNLNDWVNAVLNNDPGSAHQLINKIKTKYPIHVSRDLDKVRSWLQSKKNASKTIGFVASSGALRLKIHGINVREPVDERVWFLNPPADVRSCHYLEVVASEYKVQGLELDYIGLCWDLDLRRSEGAWNYKCFSGTMWQNVNGKDEQQFILNTYRVLLTRAREGLIIFVPNGDQCDPTRVPDSYDQIFDYLISCGIVELPN